MVGWLLGSLSLYINVTATVAALPTGVQKQERERESWMKIVNWPTLGLQFSALTLNFYVTQMVIQVSRLGLVFCIFTCLVAIDQETDESQG